MRPAARCSYRNVLVFSAVVAALVALIQGADFQCARKRLSLLHFSNVVIGDCANFRDS